MSLDDAYNYEFGDFMPSTEVIREAYSESRTEARDVGYYGDAIEGAEAEFDRWLEVHDGEVYARGYRDGRNDAEELAWEERMGDDA